MFSEAKTRLADLIVSLLCEAGPMPKTQLAKLVLWAEIEYFRRTGRSITGLYFVRQNDGPVIAFWDEVLAEGKGRDWRQQTEPTRIAEEGREKVRYLYEPLRKWGRKTIPGSISTV